MFRTFRVAKKVTILFCYLFASCRNVFRTAPFHRLHNCLFPMLNAFDAAAKASGCIYAEAGVSAPFVQAFLHSVFPESLSSLRVHQVGDWNRTTNSYPMPPQQQCSLYLVPHAATSPKELLRRATRRLLPRYMSAPDLASSDFHNILVTRQRTRRFVHERGLLARLRTTTNLIWHAYTGAEPVVATLRLFGNARTVVGFHGAGLLNMAFSRAPRPHVHELSTFISLDSSKRWRSYLGDTVTVWNETVANLTLMALGSSAPEILLSVI